MSRVWVLCLISLVLLSACQTGAGPAAEADDVLGKTITVSGGQYTDISVAELQVMLENKDFTLVNVHIPFEGNIHDTDVSIPYNEMEQNLELLPAEKDSKIVLYCRSDRMSNIAAETLVGLGYTNIWNLDGGMVAWEQDGLPIEGR